MACRNRETFLGPAFGPDSINRTADIWVLIFPWVKRVHSEDGPHCHRRLESTSSGCKSIMEKDLWGREMSLHLQEQCLDILRKDLRWATNIKFLWQISEHAWYDIHDVFYMCVGKEENSLINEDKQEVLPKLPSQILFSHVVQVEGSGKKQLMLWPAFCKFSVSCFVGTWSWKMHKPTYLNS